MIKTDSRESMTDQQRWVMDNLLGETVTSTQYEVANLPTYGIRGSRSYQPYIIATNQLGMKIHEPVSRLINKSPIDSQGYLTALLKQVGENDDATLRLIEHFCILSTDVDSGSHWVPVKRDRKAGHVGKSYRLMPIGRDYVVLRLWNQTAELANVGEFLPFSAWQTISSSEWAEIAPRQRGVIPHASLGSGDSKSSLTLVAQWKSGSVAISDVDVNPGKVSLNFTTATYAFTADAHNIKYADFIIPLEELA